MRPARLASTKLEAIVGPAQTLLVSQISQWMEQSCFSLLQWVVPLIHIHIVKQCHPYLFVLYRFVCLPSQGSKRLNHQSQQRLHGPLPMSLPIYLSKLLAAAPVVNNLEPGIVVAIGRLAGQGFAVDNNYSFGTYVRSPLHTKNFSYPSPHSIVKIRMGKLMKPAQPKAMMGTNSVLKRGEKIPVQVFLIKKEKVLRNTFLRISQDCPHRFIFNNNKKMENAKFQHSPLKIYIKENLMLKCLQKHYN